jgi:hypothetical protein
MTSRWTGLRHGSAEVSSYNGKTLPEIGLLERPTKGEVDIDARIRP